MSARCLPRRVSTGRLVCLGVANEAVAACSGVVVESTGRICTAGEPWQQPASHYQEVAARIVNAPRSHAVSRGGDAGVLLEEAGDGAFLGRCALGDACA